MPITKSRLSMAPMSAVLPASDIKRARDFYERVLGLEIADQPMMGGFMVHAGNGTQFFVYETKASHGDATVAGFLVDDLEGTMRELRDRGVMFEEYDMPGMKTVNGVVDLGDAGKSAWFKDSEGNIISVNAM